MTARVDYVMTDKLADELRSNMKLTLAKILRIDVGFSDVVITLGTLDEVETGEDDDNEG